MQWLYTLATPFVLHASRAFVVAAVALLLGTLAFLVPGRGIGRRRTWPLLALGVAWLLFGVGEAAAARSHANIRVDLLVTWPALCLVSVTCIVLLLLPNVADGKT